MEFRAWQAEVVAILDQLVEKMEPVEGGITKFLEKLSLPDAFFRDLRRRIKQPKQRLPFDDLFTVFKELGEHPMMVLYEAGRKVDPGLPELPMAEPFSPSSELSRELLDELSAWVVAESGEADTEGQPIEEIHGFPAWRRLHHLVLSAPCEVLDNARPALLSAAPAVRPRILAVVGTALRKTGDLDGAAHLIAEARQQAQALGDLWAEADATHRLSRVTLETGDVEEALRQVREAGSLYLELGDRAGIGRALMSQGHYFAHSLDFVRAGRLFQAALRQLPSTDPDNRFSALMNLARISSELDQPETALRWLRSAAAQSAGVAKEMAYGSYQTRGAVAFEVGHYEEAIDCFRQCRQFYLDAGIPLEAAYSTVWLCHALLQTGRIPELVSLAHESLELIGLLKRNRVAAGVMASLVRQLKNGEIRVSRLVEYRQTLEELRQGARRK